jgi:DNA-binding HxlR family transcriptional regulator
MKKVTITSKDLNNQAICPMVNSMKVIGGKWKLLLIYYMNEGVSRFSEFRRAIPPITAKMLTQQLRELEADGVVNRKVYAVIPPRVEYSLTTNGLELLPIIASLHDWGKLDNKVKERPS